ncbi:hypothetical protein CR513_38855, partial [Mucuna pruriens]
MKFCNHCVAPIQKVSYASIISSLIYAQVCTCPDIAFIISLLGRYVCKASIGHCQTAKYIIQYLKGAKKHLLTYKRFNSLEVICYSDFDYGGCPNDHKSTSGYIFMLVGGAISWKSVNGSKICSLLFKVCESISRPLTIYCDNSNVV